MFKKIVWLWFSSKWKNAKDVKEYIKSLVDWGAEEFMTWYNPSYWFEKFWFEVSPNGRFSEHEQITDYETLKHAVNEVHSYNLEIFVNLNAWYYTSETFPLIKKMVDEIIEIGFDWIICWNISILEYLKEINYSWKINVSTILALYNKESIRFFIENYKVNKVILSRELTLKEIESLVTEFPNIQFEVFWEWDFCRYNNWLCFAEHKYGSKDICTVVVNDLVIKKKFRPDYKKIVLDKQNSNIEKVEILDDKYTNPFEKIENLIKELDLWININEDWWININTESNINNDWLKEIEKLILSQKDRIDLYYDALKSFDDKDNKNIIIILKWINFLIKNNYNTSELKELKEELENQVKSGIAFNLKKEKELGWQTKIASIELASFYSKSDNLNLFSYLFFSKFKNIVTVKFPTRWRSSTSKLALIEETLKSWEVDNSLLSRQISIKRAHYDLTSIFWDKQRFRKLLKKF